MARKKPKTRRRVIVATDASYNRPGRQMGVAAVTEDGRYATHVQRKSDGDTTAGELDAILLALSMLPDERLHLYSDSLAAVDWALGKSTKRPSSVKKRHRLIRRAVRKGDLHVEWVRGHASNGLNRRADSMARYASRIGDQDKRTLRSAINASLQTWDVKPTQVVASPW